MTGIVGILLAAGSSRRFGADKRLHPLPDGTPMALVSARHLAAVCERSIIVIRPDDHWLSQLLHGAGLETLVCPDAELGMGHSLAAGVAASPDAAGWLIALADMPYIAAESYQAVLTALRQGAALARPMHQGKMGHPVGFAARYFRDLTALSGDQGGKTVVDADPSSLVLCRVDDPGVLKDIDVPVGLTGASSA